MFINGNYQDFAHALMHIFVYENVEKGKNPTGYDVSEANGTMINNGILNENMVSKLDNMYNPMTQRNLFVSKQNIQISKSSSHSVSTIVQPTHEISRPQENPDIQVKYELYNAKIYSSIKASKQYF